LSVLGEKVPIGADALMGGNGGPVQSEVILAPTTVRDGQPAETASLEVVP
jgi:hypothetical protein